MLFKINANFKKMFIVSMASEYIKVNTCICINAFSLIKSWRDQSSFNPAAENKQKDHQLD